MLRLTLCSLLSLFIISPTAAQIQAAAPAGIPNRIDLRRPAPEVGPTRVYVGLYILDISQINDVEQSMTADFAVRVRWHDPRLATDEPGVRTFKVDEIWHPRLMVFNARRLWKTWPEVFQVDEDGNVQYRQRYYGTLTARLDLHDFPFDRNTIMVRFLAAGYSTDELELIIDESVTGRAPDFSLVDASVGEGTAVTG